MLLWIPMMLLAAQAPAEAATPPPQDPPPHGYRSLETVEQTMLGLGARELTRSHDGRPVWIATFGASDQAGRPTVLVVANLEGDRLVASETALRLCQHFASKSPLTDAATVHVVPVANPDAMARALAGKSPRRGIAIDEDRDGRADEDGPDDLDGDGLALWMRYPDPTGDMVLAADDPRLMESADIEHGQAGRWRVVREGHDDDGDGQQAEDDFGGIELEANFAHRWVQHARNAGPFQMSEGISHALADLVLNNERLALVVVLGAEDNLADPPRGADNPGLTATEPWPDDAALLKVLGDRLFPTDTERPRGVEHRSGNFADWVYFQVGIPVLESALWSPPLDVADEDGSTDGTEEAQILRWADQALTHAFVPWQPFAGAPRSDVADGHSGIEIGGWLPLVRTNPPAASLDPLGTQWSEFMDSLANDFARLTLTRVETHPLGGGVIEVEATVANTGLFATASRMAQSTRRQRPAQVFLELPEQGVLLSGQRIQALPRLAGLGGNHALRWLIRLPEGTTAQIRVLSRNAGEVLQEIQLP